MFDLEIAQQRVEHLNEMRFARALAGTSVEFQYVLQMIPLLLQVNIPNMPAYTPHAPFGISNFQLTDFQKNYLAKNNIHLSDQKALEMTAPICGVYAMGSTASITQTSRSDLDIWVCHTRTLNLKARELLLQKCLAIQSWAKSFKVDINLYLMDQQRFRHFEQTDSLTTENCGSSQYMLLLDEFYRSVIPLAGKPLLWLHLPIINEYDYDKTVEQLVANGQIHLDDWVDFGGLGALSANEYFGATLWHLYKGIDSPYKAAIKILLLECYSWEYPHTELISHQFKLDLLLDRPQQHNFDPYLAMLQRVTSYLEKHQDYVRLEHIRRCFYIKACEDVLLQDIEHNWRLKSLENLVKDWHWSPAIIAELNNRPRWKVKQVKRTYDDLVQLLMLSYRKLMEFGRKYHIEASIIPEDINILTRKLYTAFEELPGKVTLFNPQISQHIAEQHITFVEVTNSKVLKTGWYAINQAPKDINITGMRYTEYNPNLNKLICWAYFNGLLTVTTQLHVISNSVSLDTLREFITDLRLSFPAKVPAPTNEELHHHCEIRHLVVVVNLTKDPTKHLSKKEQQLKVQQKDLFNFSGNQLDLIGSIDLTYRNLWNEIRTLHFSGENAILSALKVLSNKIYRSSAPPKSVNILCYSQRYRQIMQRFISVLVHKCINSEITRSANKQQANMATWDLFFENNYRFNSNLPSQFVFDEGDTLFIEETRAKQRAYPFQINSFSNEGFLQFFFEDNSDDTFNVYILDEKNNLEVYHNCTGPKNERVFEIKRIYSNLDKSSENTLPIKMIKQNFNFPQFYQILNDEQQVRIVPYDAHRHEIKHYIH